MSKRTFDDWRVALLLAYERGRRRNEPVVNVSELAASPEGLAALGVTSALVRVCATAHDQRLIADAVVRGDLNAPSGHEAACQEASCHVTRTRALPPVAAADEDTRRALLKEHLLARRPPPESSSSSSSDGGAAPSAS